LRRLLVSLLLLGALAPAWGCRSPKIRERALAPRPARADGAPRRLVPAAHHATEAEGAFESRRARVEALAAPPAAALVDLAERASALGARLQHKQPALAMLWHRDAAAYGAFALAAPGDPAERARAIDLHNAAVERLLRTAGSGPDRPNPGWRDQLAAIGVELTTTAPERSPLPLDELWIARDFRVRNLDLIAADGLGVPVVTLSAFPDRRSVPDRFYPPRLRLAATAVLQPGGPLAGGAWRMGASRLVLHDPAREATAPGGTPLAADLTTPLAHQMLQTPANSIAWGGLLRPGAYASLTGILLREPYQPGKIPVLFIHGLWSSPATWLRMTNELQADPEIRRKYQFWYAIYPTGDLLMVSAGRLRAALGGLRDAIDPAHADGALDQMVVVGHSMGGVIARQMLLTSGDAPERMLFTRPFDGLVLSPEARATLLPLLRFEPVPSIRRAVFLAAPHRGSNVANQLLGRVTTALVRREPELKALHAEVVAQNGRDVFQPRFRRKLPSSVDNLEWESPTLRTLEALPSAPGVPYHSIIPTLAPGGPRPLQTDGIVSYTSAHLDGAASEVVIQGTHFCTGLSPAGAEVARILRLHAGLSPDSTAAPP
jgi:pimeloyl-ACP methyl ester carboxylesterase